MGAVDRVTPLLGREPATPGGPVDVEVAGVDSTRGRSWLATIGPAVVLMVAEAKGVSGTSGSCQHPRSSRASRRGRWRSDKACRVGNRRPGWGDGRGVPTAPLFLS